MHEDAIEASAPDACHEHNNGEHKQRAQKAGPLCAFTAMHIRSVFFASACELSTRARSTGRLGAMQRR